MTLSWVEEAGRVALSVAGVEDREASERWAVLPEDALAVSAPGAPLQTMTGTWTRSACAARFEPRFPFVPGVTYAVLLDGRRVGALTRPLPPRQPTTVVTGVHPSVSDVPLNLLRVYVHFSAPMAQGHARRSVQVRQAGTGEPIEGVFLDMNPELWDPSRTRLTLLLDPGRIKRGLVPHTESGYPLTEGEAIELTIDGAWPDAAGQPLQAAWSRRYEVGPAVRVHVRPGAWQCDLPAAGTRDALAVRFDRPLDRGLIEPCLTLLDESTDGSAVPLSGAGASDEEGLVWRFTPARPWREAVYCLRVDGRLEDLAGNSVVRVFDRDLERAVDDPVEASFAEVSLPVGVAGAVRLGPAVRYQQR